VAKSIDVSGVDIFYGTFKAVEDVSMTIEPRSVTAFIGPSGCGKSTVLRTLNRMHEVIPGARVEGKVLLDGEDIYGSNVDPVNVRRTIGMVFQKPNPFPTMSIYDNVVAGLKLAGRTRKSQTDEIVEKSLRGANLWEEVKDRLGKPGAGLSGGQQQRLCIARAIAVEPQVLLMDEPFASVDAQTRGDLEDLVLRVREQFGVTIVFVTHDIDESVYLSDRVVVLTQSPTEVKEIVEVDLPMPRDQIATKELSDFAQLRAHVHRLIRREREGVPIVRTPVWQSDAERG
jgi:phosphate transport system ATP-binding protein